MLEELKNEMNYTRTENGALTYRSTGSALLDLFGTVGALRGAEEAEIVSRFAAAFAEDRNLAMKLLFFARDVRGGLGERRVFRVILRYLANREPESVLRNIPLVAEYGRYDDLLELLDTPCAGAAAEAIGAQMKKDMENKGAGRPVSLLAKWLPSANASSGETVRRAKKLCRLLGMAEPDYRRTLTALRASIAILENNLRERDYTFDYEKQPSKALFKYRAAFRRNDGERYGAFLERVQRGDAVLHTGTLMPYEIVNSVLSRFPFADEEERRTLDAAWNAMEDFTCGENALAVIDGSGSMYGGAVPKPASVALSLGIYFAEHNRGPFRDHFITFSHDPRLVRVQGRDIAEKVEFCASYNEIADTNLQAVFETVLMAAERNRLTQAEMPARLYIISDMEFNECVRDGDVTNFEYARELYERLGYRLPEVVFWNVASRNRQQPVTRNEQGVLLISGCTPRVFSMVQSGVLEPWRAMLDVLNSERYAPIAA